MSDMSEALHQDTDYIPPLKVHIVSSNLTEKRPEELRTSHRTFIFNAANPYQIIAGYDPARVEMYMSVLDNPVVLCSSTSQASDTANTTGTLTSPNGRILPVSNGSEYCIKGPGETWIATNTYPTRVGVTFVRKI